MSVLRVEEYLRFPTHKHLGRTRNFAYTSAGSGAWSIRIVSSVRCSSRREYFPSRTRRQQDRRLELEMSSVGLVLGTYQITHDSRECLSVTRIFVVSDRV